MAKIWDEPRSRGELVKTWLHSRDGLQDLGTADRWKEVNGPVSAAMVQLWRIGAKWPKPFAIDVLGYEVNLLTTPPKVVYRLLREQARVHLDALLLERLCHERGWNEQHVRQRYQHGIDWTLIREMLLSPAISPAERHALLIVCSGGMWSDVRRWMAGMAPTGTCYLCISQQGSDQHQLHECEGLQWELMKHRLLGRLPPTDHFDERQTGLEPLLQMGLPPRDTPWQPLEIDFKEGHIEPGHCGEIFGDGSGLRQNCKFQGIATWSLVADVHQGPERATTSTVRGIVPGWESTVPRGELSAYCEFLRLAGRRRTWEIARRSQTPRSTESRGSGLVHGTKTPTSGARPAGSKLTTTPCPAP